MSMMHNDACLLAGGQGSPTTSESRGLSIIQGEIPSSHPPAPQDHSTLRRKSNRSIRWAVRVATAGGDRQEETPRFRWPQRIPTLFSGLSTDGGRRNSGSALEARGERPPRHVHPASWWHARRLRASKGPELLLRSFCPPPPAPVLLATDATRPLHQAVRRSGVTQTAALNGGGVGLSVSGVSRVPNAG